MELTLGNWIEIAVALSVVIQITPIKLDPWSWLIKRIGAIANEDTVAKLTEIEKKLDLHIEANEAEQAKQERTRILRFNDELMLGTKHTKEHFDTILIDCTSYQKYSSSHTDFQNNVSAMAMDNIKRVYRECMEKNSFL